METGDVTSLFLYVGHEIKLSGAASCPGNFIARRKSPRCPLDTMLGRPKTQRGLSGVETNLMPLPEYEPLDRLSRSFITIPTELHRYVSGDGQFCDLQWM